MASCRQSRRLLECIENNFLGPVIDNPSTGDTLLGLLVTNARELMQVKTGGILGCGDHALVEFAVLKNKGQAKTKVRTLSFRKAKFQSFKELLSRTPWEMVLRTREQNRAGRWLRMLATECKSSQSPGVRNQARKGRDQRV